MRQFIVNSYNIHRIILTSVRLANKYNDDNFYKNSYFAKIGGISCNELNELEKEYLFLLNFNLYVSLDDYVLYYNQLNSHIYGSVSCPKCSFIIRSPISTIDIARHIANHDDDEF